jgi:hypothetical protein
MHASPDLQMVPQVPQFALSVVSDVQMVPHLLRPWGQLSWHVPALQTSPVGQVLSHVPQ